MLGMLAGGNGRPAPNGDATEIDHALGGAQRQGQRRFDVVMAWSVDRLGRSVQALIGNYGDSLPIYGPRSDMLPAACPNGPGNIS